MKIARTPNGENLQGKGQAQANTSPSTAIAARREAAKPKGNTLDKHAHT